MENSGYTIGYLSKVEISKKALPVSTLILLSRILDVSPLDIFGEATDTSPACLPKKTEIPVLVRDRTLLGYTYQMLSQKFHDRYMQPYALTLPKKGKSDCPPSKHRVEECRSETPGITIRPK